MNFKRIVCLILVIVTLLGILASGIALLVSAEAPTTAPTQSTEPTQSTGNNTPQDMKNGDKTFDSLCIVDRPPYDVLSPENLYKVRASVVEISNTAGKKGAGLIISESFVLTSANIVESTRLFHIFILRKQIGKIGEGWIRGWLFLIT